MKCSMGSELIKNIPLIKIQVLLDIHLTCVRVDSKNEI